MATGKAELRSYHEISCPSIDEMVRCKPVSIIIPGKPPKKGQSTDEPSRRMTLIGKIGRWGWNFEPVIVIEVYFGQDALGVDQWRKLDEPSEIEAWLFVELMSALADAQQVPAREAALRAETAAVIKDKNELAAELHKMQHDMKRVDTRIETTATDLGYDETVTVASTALPLKEWRRVINDLIMSASTPTEYDEKLQPILDRLDEVLS